METKFIEKCVEFTLCDVMQHYLRPVSSIPPAILHCSHCKPRNSDKSFWVDLNYTILWFSKMESFFRTLLKMALVLCGLLMLVQSQGTSASEVVKQRNFCGTFLVSHSNEIGQELFFIDGKVADRHVFCKALRNGRECFYSSYKENQLCSFHFDEHLQAGRKILRTVVGDETSELDHDKNSQAATNKYTKMSLFYPQVLAMAAPALFVLVCALLCPCFQARKKETVQDSLAKEPNAIDSSLSLEMNPINEKFPSSPQKMPSGPLRGQPSPSRFSMSSKLAGLESVHLNMNQVVSATNNFSQTQKIGGGGFGTVYKAELPNGQVVAVKRARKQHTEALQSEFRSEIELLNKIDHRNLVKLLGYIEERNERLIITEYLPNGSLREHLDGLRGKILNFSQRIEISIDVAHALTYLHLYSEKQIIHRDVKSSNILLTESARAKVADFGFARLGEDSDKSHITTKVKGTIGYLDPEYTKTTQLTAKSDVYSFGILLLEILSGRRPVDINRQPEEAVAIRWAFKKCSERMFVELLDPLMDDTIDDEILAKLFGLVIHCAAPTQADRPDMRAVGERLWGIRMDYMRNKRRC